VWRHLDESKTDFVQVAGITQEQRGIAESETATQATILDIRSRMRESSARTRVADWLADISRLILLTVRENMSLPIWVKQNVDPYAAQRNVMEQAMLIAQALAAGQTPPESVSDPGSPEEVASLWREIQSDELGEMDVDVFIDLASMSPITEDAQRNSWSQVLVLLTNPSLLAIVGQSEVLLRKTLSLYGIRAESEIREIKRVVQLVLQQMMQAAQAQAQGEGGGSTAGSSAAAASAPAGGDSAGPASAMMRQIQQSAQAGAPAVQ
jgi:hypothetical protein